MTLDAFLPYFVDHLEDSSVDTVIVMNLDDFLPEKRKGLFMDTSEMPKKMKEVFNIEQIMNCLMNLDKIKGVKFIKLDDLRKAGAESDIPLPYVPTNLDRDISYYYTSGTTGKPKCVVYKEYSLNAYVEKMTPPAAIILGDANGDGVLDIDDVTLIRRYLAGIEVGDINLEGLDVNGDGDVDMINVTFMQRALAGVPTPYPFVIADVE